LEVWDLREHRLVDSIIFVPSLPIKHTLFNIFVVSSNVSGDSQPFNGNVKTAEQRTIIQQYSDGTLAVDWWADVYLVQREGAWAGCAPIPFLAVPNVTAHPSTASVPTVYYSMWHYNYVSILKG